MQKKSIYLTEALVYNLSNLDGSFNKAIEAMAILGLEVREDAIIHLRSLNRIDADKLFELLKTAQIPRATAKEVVKMPLLLAGQRDLLEKINALSRHNPFIWNVILQAARAAKSSEDFAKSLNIDLA